MGRWLFVLDFSRIYDFLLSREIGTVTEDWLLHMGWGRCIQLESLGGERGRVLELMKGVKMATFQSTTFHSLRQSHHSIDLP